jgi:hypothetical protein
MKKKLTVALGMVAIIWVVFGLSLIAHPTGRIRLVRIPYQERISVPTISFTSGAGSSCEISNDDSLPAWGLASFDSGMGMAVYMDPTKCESYPYPFKITGVSFFLSGPLVTGDISSIDVQVSIRDVSGGNKCNGPGSILRSESFTTPGDSGWMNLNLSQPVCVVRPFFLEVMYQSRTDGSVLPSLMMDEAVATGPDTCDNWFLDSLGYHKEFSEDDPIPGDAIIRATGYTNSVECESLWYWKPDTTDAPNGMPDFDQYQFGIDSSGMCGPTAVANCLWWFGGVPPGVTTPDSLIRLLSDYFHTNPTAGTFVDSMQVGLAQYFRDHKFNLYGHTFVQPKFYEMEDSLKKCQDIILLLGFWQQVGETWIRFGGHYVTMAGVYSESLKIALSDPARDAAESDWSGRVRPPHDPHPSDDFLHNNPAFVSHDVYRSDTLSLSPGNPHWGIPEYEILDTLYLFEGKNFQPGQIPLQGPYHPELPIHTEVEYAIMICPGAPDTCWYWKPDTTHAPSGMPDFDQYQFGPPDSDAFCGPTAVANCLWWFNAVPSDYQSDPAGFISYLAEYLHTHPDSGTYVDSIQSGLDQYFADHGFFLRETTYVKPSFQEMEDSLRKCQDIILLLGFWQQDDETWYRVGGHFVTMSGVCSSSGWVAFSDPAKDAAEAGRPGRVRPQMHPPHVIGDTLHNDPQYVSHDMYQVLLGSPSPGGLWGLPAYDSVYQFEGDNFQPGQPPPSPYDPTKPTFTEVEYAIMICPKPSAVEDEEGDFIPKEFELYQNHPNPFNTETQIKYQLKKANFVTLSIYNILGEKVRTLVKEKQAGGLKTIIWNGRDEKGNELASGIYFYELKAGEVTQTKRMVLLK